MHFTEVFCAVLMRSVLARVACPVWRAVLAVGVLRVGFCVRVLGHVPVRVGFCVRMLRSVPVRVGAVSCTPLRAHETPEHLVCRLLLEKKNRHTTLTA